MSQRSDILVRQQKNPLRGTITVPGDKSISHRAVILAALAAGTSFVRNWLPAGDTLATLAAVRALGVEIVVEQKRPQGWDLRIKGRGHQGLIPPSAPLDCRNAGTAMRLLAGVLAGQPFDSILDGSEQLRKRPMRRIIDPLQAMGSNMRATDDHAPLYFSPAGLDGIEYAMPVASAQVKSAILLAGLYAGGETRVSQPGPSRDHTECMLAAMGVDVRSEGQWVTLKPLKPGQELRPLDLTVPGDVSSAAFPLAAAAMIPHSSITLRNLGLNETRTGLVDILGQMGATVTVQNEQTSGGELLADLSVTFEELHAVDVGGPTVVRAIDEFPIWAVLATQAAGESHLRDAAELRVKEVDRIGVLAAELRQMGATIDDSYEDGFSVSGPAHLRGTAVDSHDDHRLAMALAVAGLIAGGQTVIGDGSCAADSFPGFVETMQQLGADMVWIEG